MEKKYVLSCINGFPPSNHVLDYAIWVSKIFDLTLKMFHALDYKAQNNTDLSGNISAGTNETLLNELVSLEHEQNKILQRKAKLVLNLASERVKEQGVAEPKICLRKGGLLENIRSFQEKVSLVVLGKFGEKHQGEISRDTIGHKVETVVRSLNIPTLIVTDPFIEPHSICLAYDGRENAKKALNFLAQQMKDKKIHVYITYVGEETSAMQVELKNAQDLLVQQGISSEYMCLRGDAPQALREFILNQNISILAMGAFGHNRLHEIFMGSSTSKIMRLIRVPMLLIH